MTYHTEFPDYPAEDMPEQFMSLPWQDVSWHNDACPSFRRFIPNGNGKEVHVYVDYVEEGARDINGEGRFSVKVTDEDGCFDDEAPSFSTDSIEKVLDHAAFLCGETQ